MVRLMPMSLDQRSCAVDVLSLQLGKSSAFIRALARPDLWIIFVVIANCEPNNETAYGSSVVAWWLVAPPSLKHSIRSTQRY
jgi:hypothetical protein